MAVVPLRFANRFGFPMIEAINASETTTPAVATFYFNDHPQRRGNFFGGFWVKLPSTEELTVTSTVEFATQGVSGSNKALYLYNGDIATIGDITTSGGIILCFYDRTTDKLQAIGVSPAPAET